MQLRLVGMGLVVLALALAPVAVAFAAELSEEEKGAGFVSMFNGKDFSGWRFTGDLPAEKVTN